MTGDIKRYVERVNEATAYLKGMIERTPEFCIVLGSGLQVIADSVENQKRISYKDIPEFPLSTAPGHKGELIFGTLNGKEVVLMNGRFHYYEG